MSGHALPGGITETKATVAEGHTAIDLHLSNQTFVEVLRDGQPVLRLPSTGSGVTLTMPPGDYTIRTDGTATTGQSRNAAAPVAAGQDPLALLAARAPLQLVSDATNRHEIDGIALVPADGHSFITITAQRSTKARDNADAETVYLRTTGGRLTDDSGQNTIRSLLLQSGSAKFRLTSEPAAKLVTITVLYGPPPQQATLNVEFYG